MATDNVVNGIYKVSHGETGSFLLRNTYNAVEKGKLSVSKTFNADKRDAGDPYPDVTFVLYRIPEGGVSKPAVAGSYTMSGEAIANLTKDENGEVTFSHTFENLDVYAPNGKPWQYFVVETDINGYESTVAPVANGDYANGITGTASGLVDLVKEESEPEQQSSVDVLNDNGTDGEGTVQDATEPEIVFSFENTYKPGELVLNGKKVWNDYGNIFQNKRPNITLNLSWKSEAGFEGGNVTELAVVKDGEEAPENEPYVEWTNNGQADGEWTYTIHNLERWAPDGTAWVYNVTEEMDDCSIYVDQPGWAQSQHQNGDATSLEMTDLINSLNGTVSVTKAWDDGGNQWGQRPQSVTVQLQAKIGENGTWGDAYDVLNEAVGGKLDSTGFKEKINTEQRLAADNWSYTWTGLPIKVNIAGGDGADVEYRVVEIAMTKNNEEKPVLDENDMTVEESALYEGQVTYSYTTSQETTKNQNNKFDTKIENKLESTELRVQKTWNDEDNEWATRPGEAPNWELTFYVQCAIATDDSTQNADANAELKWEWLMRSDDPGKYVTYTMTNGKVDGEGVAALQYLPKYDDNGKRLVYRVVEQVPFGYEPEGNVETVEFKADADNDSDVSDKYKYVVANRDSSDNEGVDQAFTNKLIVTLLKGTKLWNDYGTGLAPDIEDGKYPQLILSRSTGTKTETVTVPDGYLQWSDDDGDGTWEFVYNYLPAVDKETGELYTYSATEEAGSIPGFYASCAEENVSEPIMKLEAMARMPSSQKARKRRHHQYRNALHAR